MYNLRTYPVIILSTVAFIGSAGAQVQTSDTQPGAVGSGRNAPAPVPAPAPTQASDQIEEIFVTAERRAQTAMKAPLSITAVSEEAIKEHKIEGLTDLQFVSPGIRSSEQNGVNRLYIRGIGLSSFASGADPSVAFYVDGVYIGRPSEQLSAFYDIARIEVLRGPQGALYGRNATGGAVNLITNSPTGTLGGNLEVTGGDYGLHQEQGALNVPLLADGTLNARIAFDLLNHDGYGVDLARHQPVNDANDQSVRGTVEYKPDAQLDVVLTTDYHRELDNNDYTISFGAYPAGVSPIALGTLPGVTQFGGIASANGENAATDLSSPTNRREGFGASLNATYKFNDQWNLTSITGYRGFSRHDSSDSDGTSSGIGNTYYNERSNQANQELSLNYTGDSLNIVSGLSYYHERIVNYANVPFTQFGVDANGNALLNYIQSGYMNINAYAAYLQATYSILPNLRVTGGGRFSLEKRSTDGTFTFGTVTPTNDSKKWSAFTPKIGLEYDLTPDTLLYVSATKGFKSGTFNIGQVNPPINPEKIKAYEVGAKSRLLDNRLEVTAAAFYYDYSDLQVNKILGLATLTTNAATASDKGAELTLRAKPTKQLTIDLNATYLDATFDNFTSISPLFPNNPPVDLKGKMLPGAPRLAATFGARYDIPLPNDGDISIRGDVSYTSRIYFSEFNDVNLSQKSVAKTNLAIRYDDPRDWSLTLWGKNITDERIASNEILGIQLWGFPIYGSIEPPATFGATFSINF